MATVTSGTTASIYCPLAGDIAVTPGQRARVRVENPRGNDSFSQADITAARTFSVAAGETLFIEAVGADVSYSTPAQFGGTVTGYTSAQLSALAAAGGLTPYAHYVDEYGIGYDAVNASTLSRDCVAPVTAEASAASANTAVLNRMLAAGGRVCVELAGDVYINKTLVVRSNTELQLGPNTTLYLADGSNCQMIRGLSSQNALRGDAGLRQVAVSGGTCTITEPGHTRLVGDQVYIEGALTNTAINGPQTVASVSGNNWTFPCSGSNPTNTSSQRIFVGTYNAVAGSNLSRVAATGIVTVLESGHVRRPGDHVYITGVPVVTNTFNGKCEVLTSNPGVSWTYSNAGANETGTGTAYIAGDTGIVLSRIKADANCGNQTNDEFQAYAIYFCNLGNSTLDVERASNARYRALAIFNAGEVEVPYIHGENSNVASIGPVIQFDSFCDNIRVGSVYCRNGQDDMVAWGVTDGGTFGGTTCPSGPGSMGSLVVNSISGSTTIGGCLKLYCVSGYDNGSVVVRSVTGSSHGALTGDASAGVSGGTMKRVVLEQVDVTPSAAGYNTIAPSGITFGVIKVSNIIDRATSLATTFAFNIAVVVDQLLVDNFVSTNYGTSYEAIAIGNGGNIGKMTLSNSILSAGNNLMAMRVQSGATLNDVTFNNIEFRGAGSGGNYYGVMLVQAVGGVINHIGINNLLLTTGQANSVLLLGATGASVEVDINGFFNTTAGKPAQLMTDNSSSQSGNIRIANVGCMSITNNLFQLSGSGTWRIQAENCKYPAGKFALLTSGTVSVSIDGPCVQLDMGASAGSPPARLVPIAGDKLYNTNATGKGLYGRTGAGAWQLVF